MNTLQLLKVGHSFAEVEFDPDGFEVLTAGGGPPELSDAEIGERLDSPIDSPTLEEVISEGERVLLVVPDATRQSGCAQILNLVVRRLVAAGSKPADINIIFATGIHRPVSTAEKDELLTPFISQRIKTINHNADDPIRNFRMGETSGGIPVELNWVVSEYDRIVLVGSVTFHYFAGFTGGRKLICPGLASAATITATHKLAFDCETRQRRSGVGTARLVGNPVHEAFVEAAAYARPSFAVTTIVNDTGRITDMTCGHWNTSHVEACERYHHTHSIQMREKRDLVVASCGGYPLDINMIQAHKTLEAASQVCTDGGTIVLLADCADGLGRSDFLNWFDVSDSGELGERLCEDYQVNGQTAWSLLKKAERYNVQVITSLPREAVEKMRMKKLESLDSLPALVRSAVRTGYILPSGAKCAIEIAK